MDSDDQFKAYNESFNKIDEALSELGRINKQLKLQQNIDMTQNVDQDNNSQVSKESALEKSNTQLTKPINSKPLSQQEHREMGLQKINKSIASYAHSQMHLYKKKKFEVEANINQFFESIKQQMYKLDFELFGTLLSEVETHPIEWLWPGRIPLGKITILDGDPGIGKSLIAINIAACVTVGNLMPDGAPGIQGGVIIIAPEDSPADTIKPRLEAVGGDPAEEKLLVHLEEGTPVWIMS